VSNEQLSFTGTLTLQDTLDLHHYRSLVIVRRSIRWFLAILSLFLISVVLVAGFHSHFTWPSFVVLAVLLYFPVGWFGLERLRVARYYRRHRDQYVESTVTLNGDSVAVENVNYQMRLRWNQLSKVVSTPRGVLFLLPPQQALCRLPQRLFLDNDKKERIQNLARQNNVSVKRMA
jgi:hypothetical protein